MKFDFPNSLQVYRTRAGIQLSADSRDVLRMMPAESVDLIMTSPPFALLRKKSYGNEEQDGYAGWLSEFGTAAFHVLKNTGSFVLDLGGAYQRGRPIRSLYNYRVLLDFCDKLGYRLAEEFFWHNPAKLPSPIEWVNKRKVRAKDSVNTVWWFSKTDNPKADITQVLAPYSERMKKLLENPSKFYKPKQRPSGHDIADSFGTDRGGAIPSNLLSIPNTDSNSHYLRTCKKLGKESHPARFPVELPEFFIKFLTSPGDVVMDIFSGSNTTGFAAERRGRKWIGVEIDRKYAALSALRFLGDRDSRSLRSSIAAMEQGKTLEIKHGSLEELDTAVSGDEFEQPSSGQQLSLRML